MVKVSLSVDEVSMMLSPVLYVSLDDVLEDTAINESLTPDVPSKTSDVEVVSAWGAAVGATVGALVGDEVGAEVGAGVGVAEVLAASVVADANVLAPLFSVIAGPVVPLVASLVYENLSLPTVSEALRLASTAASKLAILVIADW